jgi:anti-sigma factor RsiW
MSNPDPRQNGHLVSEFGVTAEEVTCRQLVELVTAYFDGVLPARTLGKVEEHLVMCDWCVTYVEQMQATVDSLRKLKDQPSREPRDLLRAAPRANGESGP